MKALKIQYKHLFLSLLLTLAASTAYALSTGSYATTSVLSRGRWVKLSIEQTGMHMITLAELRAWGFDDPSKVRVYGYGGKRLSDKLNATTYIDDLPLLQSELTQRGLVFYAEGATTEQTDRTSVTYYTLNPYSTHGYYFISDTGAEARTIPVEGRASASSSPATSFTAILHHETEAVSPNQSGHMLVGEDFRFTSTRRFNFSLPGRVDDTPVNMRGTFYAKSSGGLQLSFAVNGTTLTGSTSDRVPSTTGWGETLTFYRSLNTLAQNSQQLEFSITASHTGTLTQAYLDNLTINYTRSLTMPSERRLEFSISNSSAVLQGANEDTRIWDVTDPLNIISVNHSATSGSATWTNDYYGTRKYAAWDASASFLSPKVAAVTPCQDIHGEPTPDMVIITYPTLSEQAERLAEHHRNSSDSLRVLVVTPEIAYNEFSSGTPDLNGLRKMLKMFYDRGTDATGHRLQYALLLGSANYDHRRLTQGWRKSTQATIPIWQTDNSTDENSSYSTDDAYGILADGSNTLLESSQLDIAVGRIPAHTVEEAKIFIDRLIDYTTAPPSGQWRNRVMLVADNGNENIHMTQTDDMEQSFLTFDRGRQMTYEKIYVDTYNPIGGLAISARDKFMNMLNSGTVWWNYVGHSSITTMGNEGLLGLKDLNNLYLRRPPFYYGATCSFAHWDGDEYSGLEMLTLSDAGGVIGGISATRNVYITRNGILTSALGKELFSTDADGRLRTIGEVLRRAKNRIGADSNKLRYVLLGDPAMRLAIPAATARLESINSKPLVSVNDPDTEPVVISALGTTILSGTVVTPDGKLLESFDGYIDLTLYDADQSLTTLGRGNEVADGYIYDTHGEQLYTGRAKVTAGKWQCTLVLPAEIADNYRTATLAMYAQTTDATTSAAGASRDFYVYGYDENSITDDRPPVIESMYLNHETFSQGDPVNTTPMLLARVSDDTGLNMSMSGIGHQMSLHIDGGKQTFSDISSSYIPDTDGSPAGSIAYQLPELQAGDHTATLKVWDIAGNSATASIDFTVDPTQSPKIFDVYTDANPASIEANFYISHNRPEAMLTVRIDVYDISGRYIWTNTTRGRADMYLSAPVRWDLTNRSGQRILRGIYVYRATVTTDATDNTPATSSSIAKRIAVSNN